jgi:hypothetical protein
MRFFRYATALLLFAFASGARADIIFDQGVDNTGTANVLFNDFATGSDIIGPSMTVRGHIQGTPTASCASGALCVDVLSNENLVVNNAGGGQATIEAADGSFTLADIFLTVPPGGVFTKIVFALSGAGTGGAAQVGFDLSVTEGNGGMQSASFTTGSGNTFYTVVAINGQDIRNINLTATNGEFETLRQLRLGGEGISEIPEPASLLLVGTVLAGIGIIRRKRARRAQAL